MRSNYKPIGNFIRLVDERNTGLKINTLLGLSISKEFIPSVANIIGSDMENYKIIRKNQFACSLMQVRRDKKMPVALLKEMDEAIISQAYPVFEIIDQEILSPEYLMMWFSRAEFDREACFYAVGGVRGGLEWEDFCNMQLPVPNIDTQKQLVKEYHTIVDRIKLNEQLDKKLEETAQAIYKQWFVDFEFPDENGNPYKSSGGEMVECDLGEMPRVWNIVKLGDLLSKKGYIRGPFGSALLKDDMLKEGFPVYEQQHAIYGNRDFRYYVSANKFEQLKRFSVKNGDLIISCSGTLGRISLVRNDNPIGIINQALLILRPNFEQVHPVLLKQFLNSPYGQQSLIENSGGNAQVNIAKREMIESIIFLMPPSEIRRQIERILLAIDTRMEQERIEIEKIVVFSDILLARLTKAN